MSVIRLMLPSILLLYFLWRSLRQRVFLLGLPFLMIMYYSVFFEKLKPLWMPGKWAPQDHLMFWLLVIWLLYFDLLLPWRRRAVRERQLLGPRFSLPEEMVLVGLAVYVVFEIALTALRYMDLGSALSEAKPFLYMGVGYCLLRGILCHAGRKETVDFLAAIVVVNTIAAGLYVLHQGLHVGNIYVGVSEYLSFTFSGQKLTRSFYFMPQFLPLAIGFCMAKRRWGILWLGVLFVTLAAVWVSYTRALVLVALVEITVVLGVRLLKEREAPLAAKRALQVIVVVVLFAGAAITLLPTESAYFVSRVAATGSGGSVVQDPNLQVRVNFERTAYQWIGDNSPLLGVGFISAAQDSRVSAVGLMAPDAVWIPLIYRLGLLGVAGAVCLFGLFAWRGTSLSLTGSGDAGFLSIVLLGVVVGVFLQGFVQWTVLHPWQTPMTLWFFAMLAAERCRRRADAPLEAKGVGSEPAVLEGVVPQ